MTLSPGVISADHILLIHLSEEDRQEILNIFETKIDSKSKYDDLLFRISEISTGKLTPEDIVALSEIFVSNNAFEEKVENVFKLSSVINAKFDEKINVVLKSNGW